MGTCRWLGAVVLVAACYSPSVHPGAPCGPGDSCPSGLICFDNLCRLPGSSGVPDAWDMVLDAPADAAGATADAPPDAPVYIPWGTPTRITSLDAVSGQGEDDPTFTSDKLTVIETSNSPDDLFECTRTAIGQPFTCTAIAALNTTSAEKSPEISPDGNTLYFTSDRGGGYDVYMSIKVGGVWGAPTVVAALTSTSTDDDVGVSPDGLTAIVERSSQFWFFTRASTAVPFGTGVRHTEFEITTDIASPSLTNGGAIVYFHAGNPRDIYTSTKKTNGTYFMPKPVTELNTSSRDAAPCVSQDDKYMMFERAGDIFETSRP